MAGLINEKAAVVLLGCSIIMMMPSQADCVGGGSSPDSLMFILEYDSDSLVVYHEGDYERVLLPRTQWDDDPEHIGFPDVPIHRVLVLLPAGKQVEDFRVRGRETAGIRGRFVLHPVRDRDDPRSPVVPDSTVYHQRDPYPAELGRHRIRGTMRGHELAILDVHPLQFIPAADSLILHRRMEVTITLGPLPADIASAIVERAPERHPFSMRGGELTWLKSIVLNPEDYDRFYRGDGIEEVFTASTPFRGFRPTDLPSVDGPPVHMVIITADDFSLDDGGIGKLSNEFQRLADWKVQKGVPTIVRTTDWIRANYAGLDDQSRIRAFIIDAYRKWGTDWVLLGGDVDLIAGRRMLGVGTNNMPICDGYFAGLDNDWDFDNDGLYGETVSPFFTERDPFWEVWIGRAPVHNLSEAKVFVDKTLTYSRAPGANITGLDEDYYERFIAFASDFGWSPWASPNGSFLGEAIGTRIMPGNFDVLRMYRDYDDHGTPSFDCSLFPSWVNTVNLSNKHYWQTDSLKIYLSGMLQQGGFGYAYHAEHSFVYREGGPSPLNPSGIGCPPTFQQSGGGLDREDVDQLTNGSNLTIVFSRGSNANGFDYESVSQHWILNPNGGAVAYVGQARTQAINWGPVDTLFFKYIFDGTANSLGESVAFSGDGTGYYGLLGDPELAPWSKRPGALTVTASPSTFPGPGLHSFSVTVRNAADNMPVGNSMVCLQQGERCYAFALTATNGVAQFRVELATSDTLRVTTTARNFVPKTIDVLSTGAAAARIVYDQHDGIEWPGMSNANNKIDAGEKIKLNIRVKNTGTSASGVTGKLKSLGRANFGITVDGSYNASKIFIGTDGMHPIYSATDSTFSFPSEGFNGIDFSGQPSQYTLGTVGGLFIWRQGNLWNVIARGDPPGFIPNHVRYRGSITTGGGFSDTTKSSLEVGHDLVHFINADSIYFDLQAENGNPADNDKFSFVAREISWLAVIDSAGTFGPMAPNATAQDTFAVHFYSVVPDRHESIFEVSSTNSVGFPIGASQFSLGVAAPILSYVRQRPETDTDVGCSAPGNCKKIYVSVRNLGSGIASGVQAQLTRIAGSGSVTDGLVTLGQIQPFVEVSPAGDQFKIDSSDTLNVLFRVDVQNAYPDGTVGTWSKTNMDIRRPCKPQSVSVDVVRQRSLRLMWDLPVGACSSDLAGFNVYRKASGAPDSELALVSSSPADSTRLFLDVGLLGDAAYVYRVASQDRSCNESEFSFSASGRAWAPMHPGWPNWVDAGTPSSPVAAQLDGTGPLEIIAAGNKIYAWKADGTSYISGANGVFFAPPTPALTKTPRGFSSTPAIADLEGDGSPEVIAAAWDDSLYVLNSNGTRKWVRNVQPGWSSPAVGDIDGDGFKDVVIYGTVSGSGLYAFRKNGDPLGAANKWVNLPDNSFFDYATPSLVDFDGVAGTEEVVFATSKGNVYGWKHNAGGAPTLLFSYRDNVRSGFMSTVAIGNIDGGSTIEGAVAQCKESIPDSNAVYVFRLITTGGVAPTIASWKGTVVPGTVGATNNYIHPPSLADLDGDGDLEILVGTSRLSQDPLGNEQFFATTAIFQHSSASTADSCRDRLPGDIYAPVSDNQRVNSGVIVADLDAESGHEIVSGSSHAGIYMWEVDCDAKPGMPILVYGDVDCSPFVGDIDKDDSGKLELLAKDLSGRVYLFDLDGDGPIMWGQFAHDLRNTSSYGAVGFTGEGPLETVTLLQNAPNPFNPVTAIWYQLARDGHVSLTIYNTAGRLVRNLVDEWQGGGSYEVMWSGLDENGRESSSGVYFYRLTADGRVSTRKMVLLR